MEKLQTLLDELRAAQSWCDHNGDHNTGMVSLSVDTLQQWENAVVDIINEFDIFYDKEADGDADTELDV